jgi:hypothetical protein
MTAWGMVDAVTVRPCGSTFETDELLDQSLVAEQPDLPRMMPRTLNGSLTHSPAYLSPVIFVTQ